MFHRPAPGEPKLAQVLGALSRVLDLAAARAPGHALRTCWIGMWLGRALGVRDEALYDLYYALLLKDAGRDRADGAREPAPGGLFERVGRLLRLSRGVDRIADERARERGERAATIARRLGLGAGVARTLRALDERWSGRGHPERRSGRSIPRSAQIVSLAQEIDLLHLAGDRLAAEEGVRARRGTWFDPGLIGVFDVVTLNPEMWNGLRAPDLQERVRASEPQVFVVTLTDERMDRIAEAFGAAVDAAGRHGSGRAARVGELAFAVGRELGLGTERLRWVRRSALLHDLSALSGAADLPPTWTDEQLERIDPFPELARNAGQGFAGLPDAPEAALELRIASVAAEFDARIVPRPGREPLELHAALVELEALRGTQLDPNCLDALGRVVERPAAVRAA